jgi:uncharacterized protein
VYGCVARGYAIANKPDLDLIAMFDSKLTGKLAELKEFTGKLCQKCHSLVRDVSIAFAYYDYTIAPSNKYKMPF